MSNPLKKLKKQKKASALDITRIEQLTLQMIEMKVIQLDTECVLHMFPQLLEGKSEDFKHSWYSNMLSAWFVMRGQKYSDEKEMIIYNLSEPKNKLGSYSIKDGFKATA